MIYEEEVVDEDEAIVDQEEEEIINQEEGAVVDKLEEGWRWSTAGRRRRR